MSKNLAALKHLKCMKLAQGETKFHIKKGAQSESTSLRLFTTLYELSQAFEARKHAT